MTPSRVAGMAMDKIVPRPTPSGAISPSMAAVAADTGEQVIACWDAMMLFDIGRSGRIPLSMASLLIIGSRL
ncbi:hypothetical protein D3C85_1818660 [compost metagenome]